jgi:hypothetical protein
MSSQIRVYKQVPVMYSCRATECVDEEKMTYGNIRQHIVQKHLPKVDNKYQRVSAITKDIYDKFVEEDVTATKSGGTKRKWKEVDVTMTNLSQLEATVSATSFQSPTKKLKQNGVEDLVVYKEENYHIEVIHPIITVCL